MPGTGTSAILTPQFPDAASVGGHNRIETQRRAEADAAQHRREQERSELNNPPVTAAPHKHSYGGDSTHTFNSTTGVFTDCYGSGGFQTCVNTGGKT